MDCTPCSKMLVTKADGLIVMSFCIFLLEPLCRLSACSTCYWGSRKTLVLHLWFLYLGSTFCMDEGEASLVLGDNL